MKLGGKKYGEIGKERREGNRSRFDETLYTDMKFSNNLKVK